jgi:hypothetical protein
VIYIFLIQFHRHLSCPDCRKVCSVDNLHPIYINDESNEEIDLEGVFFSRTLTLSQDLHCKDEIIKKHTAEIEKLNMEILKLK